jgi:hypothetical protein
MYPAFSTTCGMLGVRMSASLRLGGSPAGWEHFWQKWVGICERNKFNHFGAVEEFFADLGEYYQDLLVARAVKVYNRKERVWTQSI